MRRGEYDAFDSLDLQRAFEKYGTLLRATITLDRETGVSKARARLGPHGRPPGPPARPSSRPDAHATSPRPRRASASSPSRQPRRRTPRWPR